MKKAPNDFTISSSDSLEFANISFSVFILEILRVSVSVVSFIKSEKQAGWTPSRRKAHTLKSSSVSFGPISFNLDTSP